MGNAVQSATFKTNNTFFFTWILSEQASIAVEVLNSFSYMRVSNQVLYTSFFYVSESTLHLARRTV